MVEYRKMGIVLDKINECFIFDKTIRKFKP